MTRTEIIHAGKQATELTVRDLDELMRDVEAIIRRHGLTPVIGALGWAIDAVVRDKEAQDCRIELDTVVVSIVADERAAVS